MSRNFNALILVVASSMIVCLCFAVVRDLQRPAHAMSAAGSEQKSLVTVPLDSGMAAVRRR